MFDKESTENYIKDTGGSIVDGNSANEMWGLNPPGNISPLINVDIQYPSWDEYHTATTARDSIPMNVRVPGLIITYRTSEEGYRMEQYIGKSVTNRLQWVNSMNWVSIYDPGSTDSGTDVPGGGGGGGNTPGSGECCPCCDQKLDKSSYITISELDEICI